MYIIPIWHYVNYSCIAWCISFLFGTMYTIPVSHGALYSQKIAVVHYSHSPYVVCFALIWRMLVPMYAILVWMMYINPMYTPLSPRTLVEHVLNFASPPNPFLKTFRRMQNVWYWRLWRTWRAKASNPGASIEWRSKGESVHIPSAEYVILQRGITHRYMSKYRCWVHERACIISAQLHKTLVCSSMRKEAEAKAFPKIYLYSLLCVKFSIKMTTD